MMGDAGAYPGTERGRAERFALDRLPEPATVAHGGWALGVLEEVLARAV
jgi:hypothetical protein